MVLEIKTLLLEIFRNSSVHTCVLLFFNLKPIKMKLLKSIAVILLFSLSACETDKMLHSNNETANYISQTNIQNRAASAFIRRGKIKKKPSIGYRMTLFAENVNDTSTSFAVLLEGANGSYETIIPPGETNQNGITKYTWDFDGDGQFDDADPVRVTAMPQNEEGEQIAEAQTLWLTPQDNDGVDINNVVIKQTNLFGVYKFKVNLGGRMANEMSAVNISVGGMETDLIFPIDGSNLNLEQDPENIKFWGKIAIAYESANDQTALLLSPGNDVSVTVSIVDAVGALIDNEVHNITVDAKPQEDGIVTQPATIRLKNNNLGFKARTKVKGTDKDMVDHVTLIFEEPFEGPAPLETEVTMLKVNGNITTNSYRSETIHFESQDDAIGSEYFVILDYRDSAGNSLFQSEQIITIEGNDTEEYSINELKVEQIETSLFYKASIFIEGPEVSSLENPFLTLEPTEGSIPLELGDIQLQYAEQEDGTGYFESDEIYISLFDDVQNGGTYIGTFKADNNGAGTGSGTVIISVTLRIRYASSENQ